MHCTMWINFNKSNTPENVVSSTECTAGLSGICILVHGFSQQNIHIVLNAAEQVDPWIERGLVSPPGFRGIALISMAHEISCPLPNKSGFFSSIFETGARDKKRNTEYKIK